MNSIFPILTRLAAVLLCLCLGCRSTPSQGPDLPPSTEEPPLARATLPRVSSPIVAVGYESPVEPSVPEATPVQPSSLDLAAQCVEVGDDASAVSHLSAHVQAHPDELMIRAYLAELLRRLDRSDEARRHFERFIADAQEQEGPASQHMIHCHTRLMEIAQESGDLAAEHLHRGIGLWLLTRKAAGLADAVDPAFREKMLFQVVGELTNARDLSPRAAQPNWYLYLVWRELGQHQPAMTALRAAHASAEFSKLTPHERAELDVAVLSQFERLSR